MKNCKCGKPATRQVTLSRGQKTVDEMCLRCAGQFVFEHNRKRHRWEPTAQQNGIGSGRKPSMR